MLSTLSKEGGRNSTGSCPLKDIHWKLVRLARERLKELPVGEEPCDNGVVSGGSPNKVKESMKPILVKQSVNLFVLVVVEEKELSTKPFPCSARRVGVSLGKTFE